MLLNFFTIANIENFNKSNNEYYMILQQEKNKQYVTMIKKNRFSNFFKLREYACDFLKCVSKSVNYVSA